jgi:hypothetical protein
MIGATFTGQFFVQSDAADRLTLSTHCRANSLNSFQKTFITI